MKEPSVSAETPLDAVDQARREWEEAWPGLDVTPGDVLARIQRLGRLIDEAQASQLRRGPAHPIMGLGDFDVLRALRRTPDPHALSHGQLARRMLVSAAGLSGRLARLERDGWIERRPAPGDGRSSLISLTTSGKSDLDAYLPTHYRFEAGLVAALGRNEQRQLVDQLRTLLIARE